MLVSGQEDNGDERKSIDILMTKLRSLVEETGIALLLVSQRRVGIETAQRRGGGGAEIDGAVLLAAAGDRGDPA